MKKIFAITLSFFMVCLFSLQSYAYNIDIEHLSGQFFTTIVYQEDYTVCRAFIDEYSNERETIVILPSLGQVSPAISYAGLAYELYNYGFNVIMYEPLGYGLSSEATRERTLDNIIDELHTTLSYWCEDEYYLMAHSIYGAYSLAYVEKYQEEVIAFIGMDSSVPEQVNYPMFDETPMILEYSEYINYLRNENMFYDMVMENPDEFLFSYLDTSYYYSQEEYDRYLDIYVNTFLNDTIIDEVSKLNYSLSGNDPNYENIQQLKFNIPVLYFLSEQNSSFPDIFPWYDMHENTIGIPNKSMILTVSGDHYVYFNHSAYIAETVYYWADYLSNCL